ncbi:unnamed protein product [Medioppia subpectinata]|uniref:N-acetyltransferase domain-containing protein n=1 Tax=Medioppia subpectinata TaxID=1979941 RepID=A0A7R9KZ47_9ACAR|nr:unnamed protein product [Medioppia subpectinata]CAG2112226.1 unnamed protein product [Medioppia subpectinata]
MKNLWTSIEWFPHKHANEVMIKADPNGIFVAEDTDSEDFANIGAYCVRPEYRGHGIGQSLWNTGMAHMGDRNIGLFAISDKMLAIYRDKHNFKHIANRQLVLMRGSFVPNKGLIDRIDGISLAVISEDNILDVIQYDRHVNEVSGFCFLLNTTSNATMIEPLYADNEQIAELLVNKCCQQLPQNRTQNVNYECWDTNNSAQEIGNKLGLIELKREKNAFTKKVMIGNMDKMFGLSSSLFFAS